MDWWVWLLIALGIAIVIGLIIFLVMRSTKKPVESVTIATTTTAPSPLAATEAPVVPPAPSAIDQLQALMAGQSRERMIQQGYNPATAAALAQLGQAGRRY